MKGLVDQLSGLSFIFIRRAVGGLEGCKLGVVSQIQVRDVKGKAGDPALGCRKAFVEGLPHQSSPVTLQSEAQSAEFVFFSFPFFAFFFFLDKTGRKCHLYSEVCFAQGRIGCQAQTAVQ